MQHFVHVRDYITVASYTDSLQICNIVASQLKFETLTIQYSVLIRQIQQGHELDWGTNHFRWALSDSMQQWHSASWGWVGGVCRSWLWTGMGVARLPTRPWTALNVASFLLSMALAMTRTYHFVHSVHAIYTFYHLWSWGLAHWVIALNLQCRQWKYIHCGWLSVQLAS